jgi:phosphate transport system protein
MSRTPFSQETQKVKNEILLLASLVEESVTKSAQALKVNDLDRSRRVLQSDLRIKMKRFEIEISMLVLMATQQPAARDLRRLAADLEICSELERMETIQRGSRISISVQKA